MVAFGGLVVQFETQFAAAATQQVEDEKLRERTPAVLSGEAPGGWNLVSPGSPGTFTHLPYNIHQYLS